MSRKFERIDKEEEERVDALWNSFLSGEKISVNEVFGSKKIPLILKEKPLAFWHSFRDANPTLPLNCLLFPRTVVEICPGCDCNLNPELLKPYLERDLLLPALTFDLNHYNPAFAELITQYPYIGADSLDFFRAATFISKMNKTAKCEDCFEESCKKILDGLSRKSRDSKKTRALKSYLQKVVFPTLWPTGMEESRILDEMERAVNENRLDLITPLAERASLLDTLDTAQAFGGTPQVAHEDLCNIAEILQTLKISTESGFMNEIEEKKWTIEALNLAYSPSIPVEKYLDIITPRREKINRLVNELIHDKGKEGRLGKINDELWEINQEISSSKRIETLTFLTNFVFDNANILVGLLAGALLGYFSASTAGCGLGGIAGGIAGKITRNKPIKVAKYPAKTAEWIKARLESPQERLLSLILSEDIKVIQIWALREKLKK